jgi:hypothetical protein
VSIALRRLVGRCAEANAASAVVEATLLTHLVGRQPHAALLSTETWCWLAKRLPAPLALKQAVRLARVCSADRIPSDTRDRAAEVASALLERCGSAERKAFAAQFPWGGVSLATAVLWSRLDLRRCVSPEDLADCCAALTHRGETEWRAWLQGGGGATSPPQSCVHHARLLARAAAAGPAPPGDLIVKHLRWTLANKVCVCLYCLHLLALLAGHSRERFSAVSSRTCALCRLNWFCLRPPPPSPLATPTFSRSRNDFVVLSVEFKRTRDPGESSRASLSRARASGVMRAYRWVDSCTARRPHRRRRSPRKVAVGNRTARRRVG